MLANSSGLVSRPLARIVSCCCWPGSVGGCPDLARRGQHVLLLDRVHDVAGGDAQRRHAVRPHPDPHAVVEGAQDLRVADARDALDRVEHVDRGVVADEHRVVAVVRREEVDPEQDGRGPGPHRDALGHHVRGQARVGERDPVLGVDLVDVRVAVDREGDGEAVGAVVAARRVEVERVLHAVDLGLDRGRDAVGHGLRVRPGVGRRDRDLRRRDLLGELPDRDGVETQEAGDRDHDRDDDRELRPVDEEAGEHRLASIIHQG